MGYKTLIEIYQKFAPGVIAFALLCGTLVSFTLFSLDKFGASYCLLFVIADITFIIYYILEKKHRTHENRQINSDTIHEQIGNTPSKTGRILDLVYIGLIICILCMLQVSDVRPVGYFVIMSILSGCVAISIIMRYDTPLKSIGKIFPLSLIAVFSVFKVYLWLGRDTWVHAGTNEWVSFAGTIDILGGQTSTELIQHLSIAITDILLGLDIRLATFMALSLPLLIITSLTVYIIALKLTNQTSALLSTLFFIYLPPVINWAQLGQTTTYGFLLVVLLLLTYTIWKKVETKFRRRLFVIILIFEFILIATHTFSAFIGFLFLLALYIGSVIRDNQLSTEELPLFLIYSVFLGIYWVFVGVFNMVLSVALSALQFSERASIPADIERYINIIPPSLIEILANMSFMAVLVVCVLLFCLIMTKRSQYYPKNIWVYLSIAFILTFGYCVCVLILTEMSTRFNSYCAFLLAILFGCILFWYQKKQVDKQGFRIHTAIVVLMIIFIGFFGLASTPINPDNHIWMSESSVEETLTVAEGTAIETVVTYLPNLNTTTYDSLLYPVYQYYVNLLKISDDGEKPGVFYSLSHSYLNWFELPESGKDNLLFRTKVLTHPTLQMIKYGDEFGERLSVSVQLNQTYANQLDGSYSKTYSNRALELIPLKRNFGIYSWE